MRLISQDGTKDCPYETSNVHVDTYEGLCDYGDLCDIWARSMIFATYSTKEKALQVMKMLQNQYKRFMTTALMNIKRESIYFRFPADEDVEV